MFHPSLVGRPSRHAFTLIELLVVIAIIAVLIGLLLPAVQKVRDSAARSKCQNNLKQIGIALHAFHDARGTFPSGHVERGGVYYSGWPIDILPYAEQSNLYQKYDDTVANVSATNTPILQSRVPIYECPSDMRVGQQSIIPETTSPSGAAGTIWYAPSSYKGMSGIGNAANTNSYAGYDTEVINAMQANPSGRGVLHGDGDSGLKPEFIPTIRDGTSNTLFAGEYTTKTHVTRGPFWGHSFNLYILGGAWPYSFTMIPDYDKCRDTPGNPNENFCKYGWGSLHGAGQINFLFCDGSVRVIPQNIDMNIFMAMSTISGGEVIPPY
jgi:prepilin-type N-terminal cleavage/methylation domain-containing protein/prepilin-type processing-associated H-X9-DG protein